MQTFHLNLIFDGVDLEDDATFDALATVEPATWRMQGTVAWVLAAVEAPSALEAAKSFTRHVLKAVPSARPVRMDEELVAIPDIARRVGVTREAVRHWADGTRQANFPLPRGIVGDNIKVWRWGSVERWLAVNLGVADEAVCPTDAEIAEIDAFLCRLRTRLEESGRSSTTSWIVSCHLDDTQPPIAMAPITDGDWDQAGEATVMAGAGRGVRALA